MQRPTTSSLVASPSSLSFGTVKVGKTSSATITFLNNGNSAVQVSKFGVNGKPFSATSDMVLPFTLAAGSSFHVKVNFKPASAGKSTGQLTIDSTSLPAGQEAVSLDGSGTQSTAASVSALSCANSTVSGSTSDACKVTLDSAAPSGGLTVSLSSSSGTVAIPGSVTVAANATSADFNATISAVTSAQTVQLTASGGGTTSTFAIDLKPAGTAPVANGPQLQVSSTTISFGNVVVNSPATQSLTLTSIGTSAVTVNSVTAAGAGFTLAGGTFPVSLAPQQTLTLNVQFDPSTTGTVQGQITISSNSSSSPTTVVTLSGAGVSHKVQLTWDAPANSPVTIQGYHIYRTSNGSAVYQLLNSGIDQNTSYIDGSVQSGQTYDYVVKAVDTNGAESPPSNSTSVTIP